MNFSSIERMRRLGSELREQVAAYIEELEEERQKAQAFLDSLERQDAENGKGNVGKTDFHDKPKSQIVIEAINHLKERVTAVEVLRIIRRTYSDSQVKDRDIRRVLSRIAKRPESPLQLTRKGKGTKPNVYRKLRLIES